MLFDDMSDRDLILFSISEIGCVKTVVKELATKIKDHLEYHKTQDERRWRVYLVLLGVFATTIAGLLVTVLT